MPSYGRRPYARGTYGLRLEDVTVEVPPDECAPFDDPNTDFDAAFAFDCGAEEVPPEEEVSQPGGGWLRRGSYQEFVDDDEEILLLV